MSEMTADDAFYAFAGQWVQKDPAFHLDDPQVREDLMTLISACMSLLAVAPTEVWQDYIRTCGKFAKKRVPKEVQARILAAVNSS
jgi:hypothetical protein